MTTTQEAATQKAIEQATNEANALWFENELVDSNYVPESLQSKTANFKKKIQQDSVEIFEDAWNPSIKNKPASLTAEDLNDPDLMRELARRDPKFKAEYDEARKEQVSLDFIAANPAYHPTEKNHARILRYLGNKHLGLRNLDADTGIDDLFAAGFWTFDTVSEAYKALAKEGRLEIKPGTSKKLTNEELLGVVADIRSGDPQAAVINYLNCAVGGHLHRNFSSARDFVSEFPQLSSEAVWFVFDQSHAGALSVEELRAFRKHMTRYPLPTFNLLVGALPAWQAKRALESFTSEETKSQAVPQTRQRELTPSDLNNLSNEDIDKLIAEERRKLR